MSPRMKAITDPSSLTGPERAAVVLLALGEEHGTIWEQLDEEEIKEISQAMAGLGTVSSAVVEQLLVDRQIVDLHVAFGRWRRRGRWPQLKECLAPQRYPRD